MKCEIPKELLKQLFDPFPSINLYVNEEKLENSGVLAVDGDYFYEGNGGVMQGRTAT